MMNFETIRIPSFFINEAYRIFFQKKKGISTNTMTYIASSHIVASLDILLPGGEFRLLRSPVRWTVSIRSDSTGGHTAAPLTGASAPATRASIISWLFWRELDIIVVNCRVGGCYFCRI